MSYKERERGRGKVREVEVLEEMRKNESKKEWKGEIRKRQKRVRKRYSNTELEKYHDKRERERER